MRLRAIPGTLWLWWWDLPGSHWWFPDPIFGHEMIWSINERGVVAWPGMIRCLFKPHSDDGYGNCCFCGWWDREETSSSQL